MKKLICILTIGALVLSACDSWLDVKPKTNVEEKDLFKNEQGFKEALTGIYIKMSEPTLYGREMTYGFLDQLAQRYDNNENSEADYFEETWYTYPSTRTQSYYENFWSGDYNLIANLNNLLANIDTRGDVITTEGYRDIIKGEALGLRSFIYFDLLRMFGPIYKDNAASPAIPYRTKFDRETAKLLPATQVIDSIIVSLHEAESLLKNDPMNISFPTLEGDNNIDPFLNYRFNRMNKYAVKAELARAYLWKGDKTNAARYASEVIEAKNSKGGKQFELITDNAQDKQGSTELIFALNMDSETFPDRVESEFQVAMWNFYVIFDIEHLYEIFDVTIDGQNDMRMKSGAGFNISSNGAYTLKYEQKNLYSWALQNTMPLIRLPEMYYILAECNDDLKEAGRLLSLVRGARGVEDLPTLNSETERLNNLEKEYRKEFYAEGQLWFFYKRWAYKTFGRCPISNMNETHYRFPIPDDETILGNIN